MIPKDPAILLSYVNTKLRDRYSSLDAFCKAEAVDKDDLIDSLSSLDYDYDEKENRFVTHWGDFPYPPEQSPEELYTGEK